MERSRYQSSIRDWMAAAFWAGVSATAWTWAIRTGRDVNQSRYLTLALATLGWSALFPGICAALGRTKQGLVVGGVLWALLMVLGALFLV